MLSFLINSAPPPQVFRFVLARNNVRSQPLCLNVIHVSQSRHVGYANNEYCASVMGLNKIIRGLLDGLRMRIRKLTYYNEYRDAMMRLERRSELEDLGSIMGSIEHDIKTPLASMSVIISRTRHEFQSNSKIQIAMDKLEYERNRIGAIVRTVTHLRGDAEYFERWMEKVNVLEVVHRSIRSLKATTDTSAIYFKIDGRDIYIKAHPLTLEQAFVNLLKIGVESVLDTEHGHGGIVLTVRPNSETRRRVSIEIVDNGRGLSPERLSEVRAQLGAGKQSRNIKEMTLLIAKKIIDIHRGDLSIESAQGDGAKVLLTFPTWEASLSEQDH